MLLTLRNKPLLKPASGIASRRSEEISSVGLHGYMTVRW